ncbi:hypothetical protein P153DRAFT_384070 [Dothidotthia symphoricarpi CBS 119687]|uniref:Uncharacterized protein n=1 Tax=Dothidotthia symphoricarpi CBS 119687 TaxID=1392245 RepID=A0A6A6AH05_9PLEO|nr:uncharacterized protein P153DRAFT_384070 [Dothidotthia symphoricarpi CBS 119687]KAF2130846.1 hypothetical protein P153DRAFT_384070 [Dothidotthia symphoricarpi CBS 119687]
MDERGKAGALGLKESSWPEPFPGASAHGQENPAGALGCTALEYSGAGRPGGVTAESAARTVRYVPESSVGGADACGLQLRRWREMGRKQRWGEKAACGSLRTLGRGNGRKGSDGRKVHAGWCRCEQLSQRGKAMERLGKVKRAAGKCIFKPAALWSTPDGLPVGAGPRVTGVEALELAPPWSLLNCPRALEGARARGQRRGKGARRKTTALALPAVLLTLDCTLSTPFELSVCFEMSSSGHFPPSARGRLFSGQAPPPSARHVHQLHFAVRHTHPLLASNHTPPWAVSG